MPGTTLLFSTLMSDDAKSIARGLRRRDPDLLDRANQNSKPGFSRLRGIW